LQFCNRNSKPLKRFGLIGFPLKHSFSAIYFQKKFDKEGIKNTSYELFPLENLSDLPKLIKVNPELAGLNVTIPYKEKIIPFLNEIEDNAKEIEAVNCIKISRTDKNQPFLKGYNTDASGFEQSILPLIKPYHKNALIIGNGGSAKAVSFILNKMNINYLIVTRNPVNSNHILYSEITYDIIRNFLLIINTTPLGMEPDIHSYPEIPYKHLSNRHLLFDLIYNPEKTIFLTKGKTYGTQVKNGLSMLYLQAEKSWELWNSKDI
jgi:shikimate dehydrogenase